MYYLYNSYCYETLDKAAQSFYSKGFLEGLGVINSYSLVSANEVSFLYTSTNGNKVSSFNYTFTECFQVGFDNSFFGVTHHQSIELAWEVVGILFAAWSIKALKKFLI